MVQRILRKSISFIPWHWRGAIKRIPVVAAFQRWLLARFLEGREFVHTVDAGPGRGLNYPITLPQDKGIWTGTYELDLAVRMAGAVRPGEPALDVGGWRGFFGGVMALAGASPVTIFEPFPANCSQIRRMIQLNPALPLNLIEAAVGDEDGTVEFAIMAESSMGKLTTSSFQPDQAAAKQIRVPMVTLDGLMAVGKIQPPAVIKIDVEGAELMVLRGARRMLESRKPILFMEIHSAELGRDCRVFLEKLGYGIRVVHQEPGRDVSHFHAVAGQNRGSH